MPPPNAPASFPDRPHGLPTGAAERTLIYDLAGHRDVVTAAAIAAGRLSGYPCEQGTSAPARVRALAATLEEAGSPLMASLARRVADELDSLQPSEATA